MLVRDSHRLYSFYVLDSFIFCTGLAKKEATLHFREYLEKYLRQLYDFLHTSGSVYAKHVYNVRVCSFYYKNWHHLVNPLALDNAILKLKHNGLLTLILTCAASSDLNAV